MKWQSRLSRLLMRDCRSGNSRSRPPGREASKWPSTTHQESTSNGWIAARPPSLWLAPTSLGSWVSLGAGRSENQSASRLGINSRVRSAATPKSVSYRGPWKASLRTAGDDVGLFERRPGAPLLQGGLLRQLGAEPL